MVDFRSKFERALSEGLPGIDAHQLLAPIGRKLSTNSEDLGEHVRKSAVGVVLHPSENSVQCILIKRPEYQGVHANQISFPGGKMDQTDLDLEFTARRECFEEINLPMDAAEKIGLLSHVHIPVSNFVVHPYVFYLDNLPTLIPDKREVDSIISFDIFELEKEDIIQYTDIRIAQNLVRKNVPFFDIQGHVVWGATGMMLAELREIIRRI